MSLANPSERSEIELRDYLRTLRRRKGVILLTTLGLVVVTLVISFLQTKQYTAVTEIQIGGGSASDIATGTQQINDAQTVQTRTQGEIYVIQGRGVRVKAAALARHPIDAAAKARAQSNIVAISVTGSDPKKAANDANTYAQAYLSVVGQSTRNILTVAAQKLSTGIDEIGFAMSHLDDPVKNLDQQIASTADPAKLADLQDKRRVAQLVSQNKRDVLNKQISIYSDQFSRITSTSDLATAGGSKVVSVATVPSTPVSPQPWRDGTVALALGLVVGVGVAFFVDYLDDAIHTKEDLAAATNELDLLGLVPEVGTWRDHKTPKVISLEAPNSPASEAYRALRTSLQFIGIDRTLQLVQITSAVPGEGKTTSAANLAVALARAGQQVIVVDCDFRRPRLHSFFQIKNTQGFTSVILGHADVAEVLQPCAGQPRLQVLPTGPPPPNPYEMLSTRTTRETLTSLAKLADFVLVDSPPILPVADSRVLSTMVDATILITSSGKSTKRNTARAVEVMEQVDAPLAGTVLNEVDSDASYGAGYGAGYGYGYGYLGSSDGGDRRRGARRLKLGWPFHRLATDGTAQTDGATEASGQPANPTANGNAPGETKAPSRPEPEPAAERS